MQGEALCNNWLSKKVNYSHFRVKSGNNQLHESTISVNFQKYEFNPTVKQRQFTGIHFLSYIGGTLGLFAGFSLLTVFELLSHFVVRAFLGWIERKRILKKVQPIARLRLVEYEKLSKLPKFFKTPLSFCHSYVVNSSVHGINHASQKNLSLPER